MALDPVRHQETMDPEPVQARLLDDHDVDWHTDTPRRLVLQVHQQIEQRATITASHHVAGELGAPWRQRGDQPSRSAQLQRDQQGGTIERGGGVALGSGVGGRHQSPPRCG